jgi:hypothetical protein
LGRAFAADGVIAIMAFPRKPYSARLPGDPRVDDSQNADEASDSAVQGADDAQSGGESDAGDDELIEVHSRPIGVRQPTSSVALSRESATQLPEPKTPVPKPSFKPFSAFGRSVTAKPAVQTHSPAVASKNESVPAANSPVVHAHPASGVSPNTADVPPEIMSQMDDGERVMAMAVGEWGARVVATNKRLVAYSSNGGDRLHDVPYEHIAGIEVVKEEPATLVVPALLALAGAGSFILGQALVAAGLVVAGIAFFFVFRGAKAYIRSSGGDVITLTDAYSPPVEDFIKLVRSHRTLNA